MSTPNCYTCKNRGSVPGSCHSTCQEGLKQCLSGLDKRLCTIRVSLNAHGYQNGRANWPFDFDPIWIDACNSYVNTQVKETA